jgi:hypothetical protein
MGRRLDRERRTIEVMVDLYCRDHHGRRDGLCDRCTELEEYALARLDQCTFGDAKPTCANCTVHCYRPEMRERVREVMRYSGPRMLLRHPVLAIAHIRDGRRRPPDE